ncbi:hypothetical protein MMC06_005584 [Schaereria dolodes]|nr:hypothetical protein [Schaereria dolodes]
MNTGPAYASTSSSTTLRPRNRRLISIEDGADQNGPSISSRSTPLSSIASSTFSSRAVSPIPNTNPSCSTRPAQRVITAERPQALSSTSATGLWETSWSSLQGIASNLLGNDILGSTKDTPSSSTRPSRKRRPLDATNGRKAGSVQPSQWGPPGGADKHVGNGSQEDRVAKLQAKKRETLLAANGHNLPDSFGRYKRRLSEERGATSAPPTERDDRDALVYLHHVQPSDTLAGITIKYHCQAAVFRKVNRLWPNDSVQIRKTVYIPIDSCGVKGRKLPEPSTDLNSLASEGLEDETKTPTVSHSRWGDSAQSSEARETPSSSIRTSPSISASNTEEPPWKHDSWVLIDSHATAVEIARLPRRSLAFFPPSRRKSVSYYDLDTPPVSLDIPRSSCSNASPRRHQSRSSSGSCFANQLQGPGGVGTLGKEIKNPGPAQDSLNKLFAAHLPNVAPRASFESATSNSSTGIENVSGAIEGWVRKMATRAAASVQSPRMNGRSGVGDLIELTDAFELEEEEDGDGDTIRGNVRNGMWGRGAPEDEEQEKMLRERFPPRGRMFEDSTRRKGV